MVVSCLPHSCCNPCLLWLSHVCPPRVVIHVFCCFLFHAPTAILFLVFFIVSTASPLHKGNERKNYCIYFSLCPTVILNRVYRSYSRSAPHCLSNVSLIPPCDRLLLEMTYSELSKWAIATLRDCVIGADRYFKCHGIDPCHHGNSNLSNKVSRSCDMILLCRHLIILRKIEKFLRRRQLTN